MNATSHPSSSGAGQKTVLRAAATHEPLTAWRITSARHASRAFEGQGAHLHGGRWNPPGTAIVYASEALSLAALELLVHLDTDHLPDDLVAIRAVVPAGLAMSTVGSADLPVGWRRYPAPPVLQGVGVEWVRSRASAVLRVPSAVIPSEANLLLDPSHPDFCGVRIGEPRPFSLDPRLRR